MGLMVTDQISELRRMIGEVVAGTRSLDALDDLATRLGETLPIGDDVLDATWSRVELLLAEHGAGHLDTGELLAELIRLAPVPVTDGSTPRSFIVTSSTARTMLRSFPALILGQPSAVVDTRRVEAHA